MAGTRNDAPRVVSNVFHLWKQREQSEGRRITIDSLVEQTGLAKNTVRRFIEPEGDVSGSPLSSAATFARLFGVGLAEVVQFTEEEGVPSSSSSLE